MAAVCPAGPGWGAAAAGWHGRRAQRFEGMVAGAQTQGAGLQPAHVCEACLGSLPASTREWEEAKSTPGGAGGPLSSSLLGLAGGPSPWAANKATTPRAELRDESWLPGGKGAGLSWPPPGAMHIKDFLPVPRDGWQSSDLEMFCACMCMCVCGACACTWGVCASMWHQELTPGFSH